MKSCKIVEIANFMHMVKMHISNLEMKMHKLGNLRIQKSKLILTTLLRFFFRCGFRCYCSMARALLRWTPFFPSLNLKPSSSPHSFLRLPHTFLPRPAPTLSFFSSSSSPAAAANYLDLSDDDLMAQCDVDTFKSSGPGGQHRNKRESAVRLCHRPTGVMAQVSHTLDLLGSQS